MKVLICTLTLCFLSTNCFARRGENDQPGNGDDGRNIKCVDTTTQATLLQFSSAQLTGQMSTDNFDLTVKARGDDVAEIAITDKRSHDSVRAKALEELLKVTLTTDESADPIVQELATHQGAAELDLSSPSGDRVHVSSSSRRSLSTLAVTLTTDELPASPITITCSNAR